METGCVVVLTTIGSSTDGQTLASVLVNERLAACVNVLGEMESVYRWKGGVESERERQLVIKTTVDRLPALQTRVHELHPYEVPEFIVLPVGGGSERYLNWIRESTTKAG
jgi:periplasmic divalent cation tolerance protein